MSPTCFLDAPDNATEAQRLQALYDLGVLDTAPESHFDDLTEFACAAFGVPEAQVTLVDSDRLFIKASARGTARRNFSRSEAFCPHTILQDGFLVVLDTTHDVRFRKNPYVVGEPHIRFYAGFPLQVTHGHNLGAFCLVGSQVRNAFSTEEQALLRRLARQASEYIENRTHDESRSRTGLVLLHEDLQPVHCNAAGKRWMDKARTSGDKSLAVFYTAMREAQTTRKPVIQGVTLDRRSFLVEAWPIASCFALFIRELVSEARPAAVSTSSARDFPDLLTC